MIAPIRAMLIVCSLTLLSNISWASGKPAANDSCVAALQSIPGSYMHYVQKSEERRGSSIEKHPEYLNPVKERQLANEVWRGEEAPKLLAPFLPPGVKLLDHQIKNASAPGVIKVEQPNGDFLILRVEMDYKGRTIATNVTVNAQALYQNLARSRRGEPLWLIGPDATAAMDWGHGGGTKTTGGHTADTLMNSMAKYNVFTIGMDQPFHGEGPREWFEDELDYLQFRVAFRKRFIHPDVPTFMIGHSYGGLIGDMVVRRSNKNLEGLDLKSAYAGVIPMSFVADPKPGSSFQEKTMMERRTDAERKWDNNSARVNEGDLDLFANLMSQDKCSALSGLQCSQTSLYNNWEMDQNILPSVTSMNDMPSAATASGAEGFKQVFYEFLTRDMKALKEGPLPSLYMMGEHDALYVLNEENIETYVSRLQNAMLWTITSRVTFRGNLDKIGHMVFDHYTPKKNSPEAIEVLRRYLQSLKPDRKLPSSEAEIQQLFKTEVLLPMDGIVQPGTFRTPTNNYSSSLMLMAYQWAPQFTQFLDQRMESQAANAKKNIRDFKNEYFLSMTENKTFETYQVIRDFVAAVLQTRGIELVEVPPRLQIQRAIEAKDPFAKTRESVISILKTYGNNLAFREFVDELKMMEITATAEFQALNEVADQLSSRQKMLDVIRKEKISDDDKREKILALGPIQDDLGQTLAADDLKGLAAANLRVYMIRSKKYVPEGPLSAFAQQNIQRRDQIQIETKALEHRREELRKEVKEARDKVSKIEGSLERAMKSATSPLLQRLEAERQGLYDQLESYDLKQRDLLEAHMVRVIESGRSWSESFSNLPLDLQRLFLDTEKASQKYQAILREIEGAKIIEALAGHLGPEINDLAKQIYGADALNSVANELNRKLEHLEYSELASLRDEHDRLLAEYINTVVGRYFSVHWVAVRDILNQPNVNDEAFKEQLKILEKALSQWRAKIVNSKPANESSSLY